MFYCQKKELFTISFHDDCQINVWQVETTFKALTLIPEKLEESKTFAFIIFIFFMDENILEKKFQLLAIILRFQSRNASGSA